MNLRKIFRRAAMIFFVGIFLAVAAVGGAKIQTYTATGEDYPSEVESQDISKKRALYKAIRKATKEAGVYLKIYSRSVNSELTDDEVAAITSNSWKLVGEPKFTRNVKKISDETTIIVWTATVEVNVDDSEIQSWIKRDDKDKLMIISQTKEANKSSEENDKKIENLREKYNRATSQAEKDSIRKQMNDADREFLANQKLDEGLNLYYDGDYNGMIKICNEAIKLNPTLYGAYFYRGLSYCGLNQYEKAIQDYNKAIQLNPNNNLEYLYFSLGITYGQLRQYDLSIKSLDKTIQLNPNIWQAYTVRGISYAELNQYVQAIQDFNKAIQLNPNSFESYISRAVVYVDLKQYDVAIQDFNNAILLNPNYVEAYIMRGCAYAFKKNLSQAINDETKAIQLDPNNGKAYNFRGLFYKLIGEEAKSQADLSKAKALGVKG